jgi:23S rRNA (cytosine1962-C5)-methyltransferase
MTPPPYPVIRLKPKTDARAIRHGAPWVFDNELVTDRRTRALAPGSIAVLSGWYRVSVGVDDLP